MSIHYISKLKWDIHGVFDQLKILKENVKEEIHNLSLEPTKIIKKFSKWLEDINDILNKIEYIDKVLINNIEKQFEFKFQSRDLIKLIFFQPSIKNLFDEINLHYKQNNKEIANINFASLSKLGDAARVMALIGDSAIGLASAQLFWDSQLSSIGTITEKRQNLVKNENLARTCDQLGLYQYRIHQDTNLERSKSKSINHNKGTLIESIYGIIYAEKGIEAVFEALIAIK